MFPEVFHSVCYGTKDVPEAIANLHTFTPAVLHGYRRGQVKNAQYPGIVEANDHQVVGIFATGLTKANMTKLNTFEGPEYERKTVTVQLLDEEGNVGEERTAEVYVFLYKKYLKEEDW
jgi:hypothetical protein